MDIQYLRLSHWLLILHIPVKHINNPSTEHGWTAIKEYSENGDVWTVEFYFKTYRETVKIVWYANMDTHSVYSGDTAAKSILNKTNIPNG